jgi:hypothetical protein
LTENDRPAANRGAKVDTGSGDTAIVLLRETVHRHAMALCTDCDRVWSHPWAVATAVRHARFHGHTVEAARHVQWRYIGQSS